MVAGIARRAVLTPRRFFGLFVVVATFISSTSMATDPDLFWHLRTGDHILANGIPRHDPGFSFTAEGWDWVTHEWLTQVLMVSIYNHIGGVTGLVIFFAAVVALAFGLLVLASDGRPYVAGFVAILGCVASASLIQARPQMFNILFSAMIVLTVERIRRGTWSVNRIWMFAPLILLWVNMHGGFVLGFAVLGVYIVGEAAELRFRGARLGGLDQPQLKVFVLAAAAGVVASLANPNTYRMWSYTYETLASSAMRDIIAEWQSPNFHQTKFWPFAIMVIAMFLAMALSRVSVSYTDILFAVGTSLAALQSARNIPIFAVVAVPILSRHLLGVFADKPWHAVLAGESVERAPRRSANVASWTMLLILALVAIGQAFASGSSTPAAVAERFPVAAVDWLEDQEHTDRRLFHEYSWGGYLIWREVPVFIDGRADVYGDDFMYEFNAASRGSSSWRDSMTAHGVELIMVRPDGVLSTVLDETQDWHEIYRDDVAIIFEDISSMTVTPTAVTTTASGPKDPTDPGIAGRAQQSRSLTD